MPMVFKNNLFSESILLIYNIETDVCVEFIIAKILVVACDNSMKYQIKECYHYMNSLTEIG